ncbi:MAG: hypothetical protein Q9167_007950 [Letrouitia subvulpina]
MLSVATYIYTIVLLYCSAVLALPASTTGSQASYVSEEPTIFRIPSSNLVLGLAPPYPPRRPRVFSRETGNELLTRATRDLRNFVTGHKLNWNTEPREEFRSHFLNLVLQIGKFHEEHEIEPVTYRDVLLLLVGLQLGFSEYGYRECAFVLSRFVEGQTRGHIASGFLALSGIQDEVNTEALVGIERALSNGHFEDNSTAIAKIQYALQKRNERYVPLFNFIIGGFFSSTCKRVAKWQIKLQKTYVSLDSSTVAQEVSVQAGELIFYHVPGTHLTVGFRLAGTRLRPARKMERDDVSRFLHGAYEALAAMQRHSGGWDHRIYQDVELSFDNIKLHLWGNHEQDHDWPTYQDVNGVIQALRLKLPSLGYFEMIFGLYRSVAPWAPESSAYGYGTFGFQDRYPEKVAFGSPNDHAERKRNAQFAEISESTNLTSQHEGGAIVMERNISTTTPIVIHYHVPGTNVMLAMTFPTDARIISPVVIPEIIAQARNYLQTTATAHGGFHASIKGRFTKTTDGVRFEVRGNPFHKGEDWPTYGDIGSVLVGIYNEIEKLNYLETRIEINRVGDVVPFGFADFVLSRRTPDTAVANLTGQLPEGPVLGQRSSR